jgi:hypothetical protein
MRRDFTLPPADVEFLELSKKEWETVNEKGVMRIIIHGYPVPPGYTIESVSLNFRIENTYPNTQIDMVYFFPHLIRKDGKPIGAVSGDAFDGKDWQRWSRHRTPANPWRPGIDNIETHRMLVDEWLKREFIK